MMELLKNAEHLRTPKGHSLQEESIHGARRSPRRVQNVCHKRSTAFSYPPSFTKRSPYQALR